MLQEFLQKSEPFVTMPFAGVNGSLIKTNEKGEKEFLIIGFREPKLADLLGQEVFSSLISRHIPAIEQAIAEAGEKKQNLNEQELKEKALQLSQKTFAKDSISEKLRTVKNLIDFAIYILKTYAEVVYHKNDTERYKIVIVDTIREETPMAHELNDDSVVVFALERLTQEELAEIGEMIHGTNKEQMAYVEIDDSDVAEENSVVSADKFRSVPNNLGKISPQIRGGN